MAIMDFNAPAPSSNRNGNGQPRTPAKDWLNIGYEINGTFISLPLGIALDTMEPAQVRGQNPDFVKLQIAKNQLLKDLQEFASTLQPGQEKQVFSLEIRVRKVAEPLEVTAVENEFIRPNLMALFAAPVTEAGE